MTLFKTFCDDRAVLHLAGSDVAQFLQGLVTQDIDRVTTNEACYACLLTPQGKIVADFFLMKSGHDILLDCDAEIAGPLLKKLRFYKLRAEVEVKDVSSAWRIGLVWGDLTTATPGHVVDLGQDSTAAIAFTDPRHTGLGFRIVMPAVAGERPLSRVDASPVAMEDYDQHRLRLGIPVFGKDILTEQTFPLDANLDALGGIDYSKGCFVGQEVASRMKRKGDIRKRIWTASTEGTFLAPGTGIMAGEATVGEISSGNDRLALARVRLDRLAKVSGPLKTKNGVAVRLIEPSYLGKTK